MSITIEELEKRLAGLETEVVQLRDCLEQLKGSPARLGDDIPMIWEARANQPAISAAAAKAFEKMGITGEPIGAEELQERMRASGIKPEDNLLSREILAMREE